MPDLNISDPYLLRDAIRKLTDEEFNALLNAVTSEAVYRAKKVFGS